MLDALGEFRVPLEATMLWLHAFTYPWPHAEPGKGKLVGIVTNRDVRFATNGKTPIAELMRGLASMPGPQVAMPR